jgi:hypothetical protein
MPVVEKGFSLGGRIEGACAIDVQTGPFFYSILSMLEAAVCASFGFDAA